MKIQSIRLKPGDEYQLVLPGYSTSGYEWILKNKNEKIVVVSKHFKSSASSTRMAGKSPEEVFHLKGMIKGSAQLTLELKRSWEEVPKEVKKYRVLVEE